MQLKSSNSINLYGFSLLRNGVKYDYSFRESLLSLSGIAQEIFVAIDEGEDTTLETVKKLPNIHIIPSTWDLSLSKGLVLSVETNKALASLRDIHHLEFDWGLYLQADEVIHEDDYQLILDDIKKAHEEGCDAVTFRYLHFWQTHHHLAIAKNWYPEEIRAIKINSDVVSYGDAQSFKNARKIFSSEARIFHYGHVRDQSIYKTKMEEMSKLYNSDATKSKYYNARDREKNYDDCLLYFGTHPLVMKERILRMNDIWELPEVQDVILIGNEQGYDQKLIQKINAKNIMFATKLHSKNKTAKVIYLQESLFSRLFAKDFIPLKMKSKKSKPWSDNFKLILKLSANYVGLKASF